MDTLLQLWLQGELIGWFLFLVYLELHPSLGGWVIRPSRQGGLAWEWRGLWPLLSAPFQREGALPVWQYSYWDMNIIIVPQVLTLAYMLGNYFLEAYW